MNWLRRTIAWAQESQANMIRALVMLGAVVLLGVCMISLITSATAGPGYYGYSPFRPFGFGGPVIVLPGGGPSWGPSSAPPPSSGANPSTNNRPGNGSPSDSRSWGSSSGSTTNPSVSPSNSDSRSWGSSGSNTSPPQSVAPKSSGGSDSRSWGSGSSPSKPSFSRPSGGRRR